MLQDNLADTSKENKQLTDEVEQLESDNSDLHSGIDALDRKTQSALHELKTVKAELSHVQQQAAAEYHSLRAQSQHEVDALHSNAHRLQREVDALHSNAHQLQRQLQSSYAQVHTLHDQLEKAETYIQKLRSQFGIGSEGRAPPGQGMHSPRPVRTVSLTGSLRSPRSPTGSSTSSTTSSRRNSDFQVRNTLLCFGCCQRSQLGCCSTCCCSSCS